MKTVKIEIFTSMNVLDLPVELITELLTYLKGSDLAKLSQTCSAFREIANIDLLWQKTCAREFNFTSTSGWDLSCREIYGKVLHKYGFLVGLWRDKSSCYGGLIHIWFDEGCIRGEEYFPTKDVREALKRKEIFKIYLSKDKEETLEWNPGFCECQPCDIVKISENNGQKVAEIRKRWREGFKLDEDQEQKEMEDFLQECSTRGTHPELCMFKWQTHKKSKLLQTLQTFQITTTMPETRNLPRPGLYKGLYGGHGTEILLLSYDLENKKAITRKISGDPNVPAGEISISADLSKPLVLTKDQQESIRSLKNVEAWEPSSDQPDQSVPSKQPFLVPREVATEDEFSLPKYCIARYAGTATVSPLGYTNPEQILSHFIVFNEDMFGGLWMDLYSLGTFVRVEIKAIVSEESIYEKELMGIWEATQHKPAGLWSVY